MLSILSKEQAVILPIIILLIEILLDKKSIKRKEVLYDTGAFFIIALIFGISSILIQQEGFGNRLENQYYPLFERFILASFAIVEYVFKILAPINLNKFYAFPYAPGTSIPLYFYAYPAILFLIIYYLFTLKDKQPLIFFLIFVSNIILSVHILPLARKVLIADRYVYLAIPFLILLILTLWGKKNDPSKHLPKYLTFIFIAALSAYTFIYALNWT